MAIKETEVVGYRGVVEEAERHLLAVLRAADRPRYAGFWQRVVAGLIDGLFLAVAALAVTYAALVVYAGVSGTAWTSIEHDIYATYAVFGGKLTLLAGAGATVYGVAFGVLAWLYYTLLESAAPAATVGKQLVGLRVTDEAGGRLSFARANARFWSKVLSVQRQLEHAGPRDAQRGGAVGSR
ncbi:MAG TPA: RDD family protein [Chloroflexota bacterium]|nr:RDD family protein [Chloroflexota bacterium]